MTPPKPTSQELVKRIEDKNNHLRFAASIFFFIAIAALACLLALAYQNQRDNTRALQGEKTLLENLQGQSKKRDTNLAILIADNKQQTLILCKLILANSNNLTATDAAQVETICKEKIAEYTPVTPASQSPTLQVAPANQPTLTPATNSQQGPGSSSTKSPAPQPEPVQVLGIPVCVPFTGVCVR